MSDVLHRDGIVRALAKGASTASALFNALDAGSLPDLMRDLRAMVEMREIEVTRVGATFFYHLTGASAPTAEAVAQTMFNERLPSRPAAPPVERRKTAKVVRQPKPAREQKKRGPKRSASSDPGKLVAVIQQHPWSSLSELVRLSGISGRGKKSASVVTAGIANYLHRTLQLRREGERLRYRYALPDCKVPPPIFIAVPTSPRGKLRSHRQNSPPRTARSLRGTLDGMLVELNALGEVRLISSGHARLNWMCSVSPGIGIIVSSNWRNDAREAVIDLRDRLAQLQSQLGSDHESTPEAAQTQAA